MDDEGAERLEGGYRNSSIRASSSFTSAILCTHRSRLAIWSSAEREAMALDTTTVKYKRLDSIGVKSSGSGLRAAALHCGLFRGVI